MFELQTDDGLRKREQWLGFVKRGDFVGVVCGHFEVKVTTNQFKVLYDMKETLRGFPSTGHSELMGHSDEDESDGNRTLQSFLDRCVRRNSS